MLEHAWSNTLPQFRQWCFRLVNVNAVRHRMHTSESIHVGAVVVDKSAAFTWGGAGNWIPTHGERNPGRLLSRRTGVLELFVNVYEETQ